MIRTVGGARREDGAVAVEFALLVPLVLMLLFGTVTTGLVYSHHLSINNAAREASRFGAVVDYSAPTWATSVRDRVLDTYYDATSPLPSANVCVRLVTSTGTSLASAIGGACGTEPAVPAGMAAGSCVVKVWIQKPESISLVVAPAYNFNISAQSVAYYGRTAGSCTAD
jgi:Flp pilus assembly protein TadG